MKNLPLVFVTAFFLLVVSSAHGEEGKLAGERRAISFLTREIAAWPAENKCFSCHNNGDAARAAYAAVKAGFDVPPGPLRETTAWLSRPADWRRAETPAEFRDDRLSAIQFAAALASALDAKYINDRKLLIDAAKLVAAEQNADGSWRVDESGQAGSPATYGPALATWSARRTLLAAGEPRLREAIAKADAWFRKHEAHDTPAAAAALMALAGTNDRAALERREQCLHMLQGAHSDAGGWGPYAQSPVEIFDTSLAILALAAQERSSETDALVDAGRNFLIAEQLADGSWVETTRPSGSRSYAQRMSTTGWATLALLATRR